MSTTTSASDPAETEGHLHRELGLRHLVLMGLAFMAPLAVFDTFGIVADATDGHVPLAYLAILVAVLFTAYCYARMVQVLPFAGSAYTYARRTIHPAAGFLVGWAATLDYLFLPMINALLSSIYMSVPFPNVPAWVWIASTVVVTTAMNLLGVKVAANANLLLVGAQVVASLAFLYFLVHNIIQGTNDASFSLAPLELGDTGIGTLLSGASILALSFLGFDAVTTLAEEAKHAERDIPRAIFIIVFSAGAFFVSITMAMQLLFPDVSKLDNIVSASPEIAKYVGGAGFQAFFLVCYMCAVLGCGLTQQLSAARLLYAMGRDRVLPHRVFGQVTENGIPALSVLVVGAIAFVAVFLDLSQAASLINFGAFVAFTAVCASAAVYQLRYTTDRSGRALLLGVAIPVLGALCNLGLLISLDAQALIVGTVWLVLGVAALLVMTRGFSKPLPEIDIAAADA
ncbi:MAG: APC family permease [Nocardioidaceae bacterium]